MQSKNWMIAGLLGLAFTGCEMMFIVPEDTPEERARAGRGTDACQDKAGEAVSETAPERVSTPRPTVKRHVFDLDQGIVASVAMSANNKYLVCGTSDATVWRLHDKKKMFTLDSEAICRSISFGNGDRTIATCDWGGDIELWDASNGKKLDCKVKCPDGFNGFTVSLSPDGKTVAVARLANDVVGTNPGIGAVTDVKIFSVATGDVLKTLSGHAGTVLSMSYSPDGKLLATGSNGKSCKIWDTTSWKVKNTIDAPHSVEGVSFLRNGKEVAMFCKESKTSTIDIVKFYDVATGKELFEYEPKGVGQLGVKSLSISPDGKHLGSGNYMGSILTIAETEKIFNWLRNK